MSTGIPTRSTTSSSASSGTTIAPTSIAGGGGGVGSPPTVSPTTLPQTVNVGVNFTQYHLAEITPQNLKLFKTNLEQAEKQGISVDRHNLIDDICKDIITLQFIILDICSIEETWKGHDHKTFFLHMAKAFGDLSGMNNLTPFDHVRQWII